MFIQFTPCVWGLMNYKYNSFKAKIGNVNKNLTRISDSREMYFSDKWQGYTEGFQQF